MEMKTFKDTPLIYCMIAAHSQDIISYLF